MQYKQGPANIVNEETANCDATFTMPHPRPKGDPVRFCTVDELQGLLSSALVGRDDNSKDLAHASQPRYLAMARIRW